MTRGQLNMNGTRPLADTALGSAGEVTGAERSKLQGILAGASNLVTSAVDGLMRATDKAKLDLLGGTFNVPGGSTTVNITNGGYSQIITYTPNDSHLWLVGGYILTSNNTTDWQLRFNGSAIASGKMSLTESTNFHVATIPPVTVNVGNSPLEIYVFGSGASAFAYVGNNFSFLSGVRIG